MTLSPWEIALTSLSLLSRAPGLGGIWLRARSGPARDNFLKATQALPGGVQRISPSMTDDALFGGLDIAQTLALGKPTYATGVLGGKAKYLELVNAERTAPELAARLAQQLDHSPDQGLLALDEGIDDEALPQSLTDRLAFHVSLDGLSAADCAQALTLPDPADASATEVVASDADMRGLIAASVQMGIMGMRAPIHALIAAKAAAASGGRTEVKPEDLELAATLVLAPRAVMLPAPPPPEEDTPDQEQEPDDSRMMETTPPEDVVLDAVRAAIPADLLEKLQSRTQPPRASGHSAQGAKKKGNSRGRPLPPRRGKPDGRKRIDIMATLRAAAPWQKIRQRDGRSGLRFSPGDLHLKRFQSRSDRLLVFTVDASGSAAVNRLAEAKGAIELMLADAYANRDHVALISYNKTAAELLLPPTRSLVQTKRRLSGLPGGGGTPLAMGLREALDLTLRARQKGFQPALVLVADGRTNIDLEGHANRERAIADALEMARANKSTGTPSIVIDMTKRPEAQLRKVSDALDATYFALPFADAAKLSNVVSAQLGES